MEYFRIVPILCADILPDDMAGAVDYVGLRNLDGPVAMHDSLRRIANSKEIDAIFQQEISVGLLVLVDADPENL